MIFRNSRSNCTSRVWSSDFFINRRINKARKIFDPMWEIKGGLFLSQTSFQVQFGGIQNAEFLVEKGRTCRRVSFRRFEVFVSLNRRKIRESHGTKRWLQLSIRPPQLEIAVTCPHFLHPCTSLVLIDWSHSWPPVTPGKITARNDDIAQFDHVM